MYSDNRWLRAGDTSSSGLSDTGDFGETSARASSLSNEEQQFQHNHGQPGQHTIDRTESLPNSHSAYMPDGDFNSMSVAHQQTTGRRSMHESMKQPANLNVHGYPVASMSEAAPLTGFSHPNLFNIDDMDMDMTLQPDSEMESSNIRPSSQPMSAISSDEHRPGDLFANNSHALMVNGAVSGWGMDTLHSPLDHPGYDVQNARRAEQLKAEERHHTDPSEGMDSNASPGGSRSVDPGNSPLQRGSPVVLTPHARSRYVHYDSNMFDVHTNQLVDGHGNPTAAAAGLLAPSPIIGRTDEKLNVDGPEDVYRSFEEMQSYLESMSSPSRQANSTSAHSQKHSSFAASSSSIPLQGSVHEAGGLGYDPSESPGLGGYGQASFASTLSAAFTQSPGGSIGDRGLHSVTSFTSSTSSLLGEFSNASQSGESSAGGSAFANVVRPAQMRRTDSNCSYHTDGGSDTSFAQGSPHYQPQRRSDRQTMAQRHHTLQQLSQPSPQMRGSQYPSPVEQDGSFGQESMNQYRLHSHSHPHLRDQYQAQQPLSSSYSSGQLDSPELRSPGPGASQHPRSVYDSSSANQFARDFDQSVYVDASQNMLGGGQLQLQQQLSQHRHQHQQPQAQLPSQLASSHHSFGHDNRSRAQSPATSASRHQTRNSTPTIVEESPPSAQRRPASQSVSSGSAPPPPPTTRNRSHSSSVGSASSRKAGSQESKVVRSLNAYIRPFKPNMRPNVYQKLANLDSFALNITGSPSSFLSAADCSSFIVNIVREYLSSPSRLGLGERTVLVMTSKVAQKSYGTEKRFLCPPPMVLVVGASWWSACVGPESSKNPQGIVPTILTPPRISISMTGETSSVEGGLDWAESSGRLIEAGNPSGEMAVSGRYIGKQLYITDVEERKHVEALVSIYVPGIDADDSKLLGVFPGKPTKVISKPSKKRQAARNTELCITHGSTISLFHRLRSQTMSTRYLCVSGAPTWFKGSDDQTFLTLNTTPNKQEPASCFVAKTTSWEPFIIYRVDPRKKADTKVPQAQPPIPGYPSPPPNALPLTDEISPICFNEPVVLQCLHRAVVSPIMIIRKYDKGTSIIGGSTSATGATSGDEGAPLYLEAPGDPVTQLSKCAFELVEDPSTLTMPRRGPDGGIDLSPGLSGSFLACLNETVGMHKPSEPRRWTYAPSSLPSTPTSPPTTSSLNTDVDMAKSTPPTSPLSSAIAYAAAQTRLSLNMGRSSMSGPSAPPSAAGWYTTNSNAPPAQPSSASSTSSANMEPPPSSDGGKVAKRPRRVTSLVSMRRDRAGSLSKGRQRGQSLSMLGMQNQLQQQQQQLQLGQPSHASGSAPMHSTNSGNSSMENPRSGSSTALSYSLSTSGSSASQDPSVAWALELAESDIWTIVGTDVAKHTFYVPPQLAQGVQPVVPPLDNKIAHLISTPAPYKPITPIPLLDRLITGPTRVDVETMSSQTAESFADLSMETGTPRTSTRPLVTLHGKNFFDDLYVFFGDWRSDHVEIMSETEIRCHPPPPFEFGVLRGRIPILLIRHDGVIFPSRLFYEC